MFEHKEPLTRPLLVFVSGAPGTGKTTLAKELANRMGLYHVERDTLKLGIEFTSHTDPKDRLHTVIPIYFKLLAELLKLRVSIIADGSQYIGESEPFLAPFKDLATVLDIHCQATNWHERVLDRQAREKPLQPKWEKEFYRDLQDLYTRTHKPLAHGYEVLEVDTTEEYQPNLAAIEAWISARLG